MLKFGKGRLQGRLAGIVRLVFEEASQELTREDRLAEWPVDHAGRKPERVIAVALAESRRRAWSDCL